MTSTSRRVGIMVATLVAAVFLAGCGGTPQDPAAGLYDGSAVNPTPDPPPATATAHTGNGYVFDGGGADVTAEMFGKKWPLTVKSGRVNCIPITAGGLRLTMVVFTADNGVRYAVNGTARAPDRMRQNGFKDVFAIWAKNPQIPGLRKDITPLIDVCAPLMK